jgi:hypothetical protein
MALRGSSRQSPTSFPRKPWFRRCKENHRQTFGKHLENHRQSLIAAKLETATDQGCSQIPVQQPHTMAKAAKGDAIRFVKGKYAGLEGWIDKGKKKQKKSFFQNVIVRLEDEEKATYVKISSYRRQFSGAARTYEEAAMMQHSDIERAMIDLAEMFAQCAVRNNTEALRLFNDELNSAREFQQKLGNKARYRSVTFAAA